MSEEKKLKLRVNLHRFEGLPYTQGKAEVELRVGSETNTSRQTDLGLKKWDGDPEFKFYGKVDASEKLHVKLRTKLVSGDDEFVGSFDLGTLPKGKMLKDCIIPVENSESKDVKAKVYLSFTAETFGVDVELFKQAEKISSFVSKFHNSRDKMKNAVINDMSGAISFGLKEAIEREVTTNKDLTFMVFPGKYMVYNNRASEGLRGGIVLPTTLETLFLYGVSQCSVVPFLEKEPMFICEGSTKIILHNIEFSQDSSFMLAKQKGISIQANSSTIGKIYVENPSKKKAEEGEESNETLIFQPEPYYMDKSKVKHIRGKDAKEQQPQTGIQGSYFVTLTETDYDLNIRVNDRDKQ